MGSQPTDDPLLAVAACAVATTVDAVLATARPVLRALAGASVEVGLDPGGTLVVTGASPADPSRFDAAVRVVQAALGRVSAEERLADHAARVDNAQQLANMGDYDWHIASDTNRWSDQLYRIYGFEPQAFNASYDRFLSLIHPDDRERIAEIHRNAYASGEPYQMIERIVRPDGEMRYLASNGQVVQDEAGTPVRMRGTCIDITDRVLAEQERERIADRFRNLVEASPDAILVVEDGTIVQANGRAGELLGGEPVGCPLTTVLRGADDSGPGVPGTGVDGRRLTLDVARAPLTGDAHGASAVFLRDAAPRLESESIAATLREVRVRRRQALEINDNVVQGLSAAVYALQIGDIADATSYLGRAIAGARHLMNDWLNPPDGRELEAGDLVRTGGSAFAAPPQPAPATAEPATPSRPRIVVVDDNDDVRRLIRIQIERLEAYEVVGEAADGAEAIEVTAAVQPDVVFLDLAMPVMDGLEALPVIRQRAPKARVIVLSGFDEATIGAKALAAGAARYVEKGLRINFREIIQNVLEPPEFCISPPG